MQKYVWDLKQREMLEKLLQEGLNISRIAKAMKMPAATIYKEIQKGTTMEEYATGRYLKYSAQRSIDSQVEEFKRFLIEGKRDQNG